MDGKAVIVQRAHNPGKGLWTFPGGFVNRGEVVSTAAAREALEEAGIEVAVGPLLGVYSFPENPTVLIVYTGEVVKGEPRALAESIDDFFDREVRPHVPDAWIDRSKCDPHDGQAGIVGYEINFNRYFYQYTPPRPLEEIESDIKELEGEIVTLLREITS